MRWIKSIAILMVVFILLITMDSVIIKSGSEGNGNNNSIVDDVVFPHDEVVDVYITIDEETYTTMNENAIEEEIVMADIVYNGYHFDSVGIRPKGNSSLSQVAKSDSNRFSFKVDFDYYISDQSLFGINKVNLNNIFSDPTMMSEYLGYEMLDSLDADASRTTYVALYINDEYFGLYLCVEQVNESFLKDHFGNANGELYKPDMGAGSDLKYISDNNDDYSGMVSENLPKSSNTDLIKLMNVIEEGEDLESVLNVDSFLKYLAMSAATVHLDAYQGGMFHNYYLYNNNGIFEWITWDLNMIYNKFPKSKLSDEEAVAFLIDEPVSGAMENYPLINIIFQNEEYVQRYHDYLNILINDYLSEENITNTVLSTYEMIKEYVQLDPTAFYTYDAFETALFEDTDTSMGLLNFISQRNENIEKQLSGEIESTNNGMGNTGTGKGKGMAGMGDIGEPPNMKGEAPLDEKDNVPAVKNSKNEMGKKNKGEANMGGGLPPGIDVEELPEELRSYIERGERPPKELMDEFMKDMPAGMGGMEGGLPPDKGAMGDKQQEQEQAINMDQLIPNLIVLLIGLVGILGFTFRLRKHKL